LPVVDPFTIYRNLRRDGKLSPNLLTIPREIESSKNPSAMSQSGVSFLALGLNLKWKFFRKKNHSKNTTRNFL
jgi:hypothetical protein